MNFKIPRVWELVKFFKSRCKLKGWEISEHEDWVRTSDDKYHNLLWIHTIHPLTFEKIALNQKCAIREGKSYNVVDVSYTAWLFPKKPPEDLIQTCKKKSEILRRVAIYDLSCGYSGKPLCFALNKTDSVVCKEFERYLKELDIKLKPFQTLSQLYVKPI